MTKVYESALTDILAHIVNLECVNDLIDADLIIFLQGLLDIIHELLHPILGQIQALLLCARCLAFFSSSLRSSSLRLLWLHATLNFFTLVDDLL